MNRFRTFAVIIFFAFAACQKNNVSKIPKITFVSMLPDSIKAGSSDTVFIIFNFVDGDGDIGQDLGGTQRDIYIKDSRYDTAFTGYFFPGIDQSIEDPTKGLSGTVIYKQLAAFITPRDSLHMVTGDTLHYEIYIEDRAGDTSNHITMPDLYIRP